MINLDDYTEFKNNKKPLKELSEDSDNKKYMSESSYEGIDFDTVKDEYIKKIGRNKGIKSNDALLEDPETEKLVFIEFKNGKIKKPEIKTALKEKIFDSMAIFLHIINENIGFSRENMEYVLVYNEEKNPTSFGVIQSQILQPAKEEIIRFGLDKFKNYFFKDVHTYTKDEFNEKYKHLVEN